MTAQAVVEENVRLRDVTEADLPVFYEEQIDSDAVRMAAFPSYTGWRQRYPFTGLCERTGAKAYDRMLPHVK